MVLSGRAQHGWTPYVDVLDGDFTRTVFAGSRGLERVQVDHHQVDARNPLRPHHLRVVFAPAEDATMHPGMQRLDTAIHDLREARIVGNLRHLDARLGEGRPRAAGGKQFDAGAGKRASQLDHAGLVGDAQERPLNLQLGVHSTLGDRLNANGNAHTAQHEIGNAMLRWKHR